MLYLQDDPDKWNPFLPGNFMENQANSQMMNQSTNGNYELLDIKNIVKIERESVDGLLVYLPNLSLSYKMSTAEIRSFSLVAMRWVSEMEDSKYSFKVRSEYVRIECT